MRLRKVWFVFGDADDFLSEKEYKNIRIKNVGKLEKRAFKWLEKEGINTGKRTWHDKVFSKASRKITFEEGDLKIYYEYDF